MDREDRVALHGVPLASTNPTLVSMIADSVQTELRELRNAIDPSRTGLWFLQMTNCLMTALGKDSQEHRHPQWQISVAGMRSDGVLQRLDEVLSAGALAKIRATPNKPKTHRPQARFYLHEIAYTASCKSSRGPLPVIPNNKVTRGGGISHLCDQIGCMRPQHLEAAWSHADDIARRGCSGILLLVHRVLKVILVEVPCPHAGDEKGGMENALRTSCQKDSAALH